MKVLFATYVLLGLFGCSSIINQGKSNNLKIDEINIPTADSPYAEVIYPNGSEIVGIDEHLDIQLDFGSGIRYINSLQLSILIDDSAVWDTTIFTSTSQSIIDDSYLIPINNISYSSSLNPNSKIEIKIIPISPIHNKVQSIRTSKAITKIIINSAPIIN